MGNAVQRKLQNRTEIFGVGTILLVNGRKERMASYTNVNPKHATKEVIYGVNYGRTSRSVLYKVLERDGFFRYAVAKPIDFIQKEPENCHAEG